jgi:Fe-S cluster assembly ATPase SufC
MVPHKRNEIVSLAVNDPTIVVVREEPTAGLSVGATTLPPE